MQKKCYRGASKIDLLRLNLIIIRFWSFETFNQNSNLKLFSGYQFLTLKSKTPKRGWPYTTAGGQHGVQLPQPQPISTIVKVLLHQYQDDDEN